MSARIGLNILFLLLAFLTIRYAVTHDGEALLVAFYGFLMLLSWICLIIAMNVHLGKIQSPDKKKSDNRIFFVFLFISFLINFLMLKEKYFYRSTLREPALVILFTQVLLLVYFYYPRKRKENKENHP